MVDHLVIKYILCHVLLLSLISHVLLLYCIISIAFVIIASPPAKFMHAES